jgi:hypothetical protein
MRGLLMIIVVCTSAIAGALNFPSIACDENSPTFYLCANMLHLRIHVKVLDAQRELMRVDYPFLTEIGQNIVKTVDRVKTLAGADNIHLVELDEVKAQAQNLVQLAGNANPEALVQANQIHSKCQACHSDSTPPSSGHAWEDLVRYDWNYIIKRCKENTYGRNPYTCKNMYGLLSIFEMFDTAEASKDFNFSMLGAQSREIIRIADDLIEKNMIHGIIGSEDGLQKVRAKAQEIEVLAQQQSPDIFVQTTNMVFECRRCHIIR